MSIRKNKNESIESNQPIIKDLPETPPLTEKEMAAANLRVLMSKLEGDDRCVACHAAKLLEQKDSSSFDGSMWVVLIFLLCFGFDGSDSQIFSSDFLDVYLKYLQDKENSADDTFKV